MHGAAARGSHAGEDYTEKQHERPQDKEGPLRCSKLGHFLVEDSACQDGAQIPKDVEGWHVEEGLVDAETEVDEEELQGQ